MTIRSEQIRDLTADLYEWSLKNVPDDTQRALRAAGSRERGELSRATIAIDAHGSSLYEKLHEQAVQRLPAILQRLKAAREGAAARPTSPET